MKIMDEDIRECIKFNKFEHTFNLKDKAYDLTNLLTDWRLLFRK